MISWRSYVCTVNGQSPKLRTRHHRNMHRRAVLASAKRLLAHSCSVAAGTTPESSERGVCDGGTSVTKARCAAPENRVLVHCAGGIICVVALTRALTSAVWVATPYSLRKIAPSSSHACEDTFGVASRYQEKREADGERLLENCTYLSRAAQRRRITQTTPTISPGLPCGRADHIFARLSLRASGSTTSVTLLPSSSLPVHPCVIDRTSLVTFPSLLLIGVTQMAIRAGRHLVAAFRFVKEGAGLADTLVVALGSNGQNQVRIGCRPLAGKHQGEGVIGRNVERVRRTEVRSVSRAALRFWTLRAQDVQRWILMRSPATCARQDAAGPDGHRVKIRTFGSRCKGQGAERTIRGTRDRAKLGHQSGQTRETLNVDFHWCCDISFCAIEHS